MELRGGRRVPPRPEALRAAGRARAEGRPPLRAARHRQDARSPRRVATRVGREVLSRRAPPRSSRCSPASARRGSASSSPRRARTRPSIIFIDELDAVGAARTGSGFNREQDQTLNQLLVELDGFALARPGRRRWAPRTVCRISTRRLLRPGRFDRQMLVAPPDLAGREAILARAHAHEAARRGRRPRPDRAPDSRADRRRPREHLRTRRRSSPAAASVTHVGAGRLRQRASSASSPACSRRRCSTDKERRILAYHEGGHALMSHLMGERRAPCRR